MRVLMVCLGNICRSPTAEAAVREAAAELGVEVEVDSAGTGSWHVGDPPDHRMTRAASEVGLRLAGSARQVTVDDFERYDLIVAMDRSNLANLRRLAPDDEARDKVRLFRSFADGGDGTAADVPDPYYGGADGFAEVVDIARRNARALVEALRDGSLTR